MSEPKSGLLRSNTRGISIDWENTTKELYKIADKLGNINL
jgi:hypothetical protein